MHHPSPYSPGSAPRIFSGRQAQLEAVRQDLALVSTYARFIGRIRIETGVRGVGKTALLTVTRDEAQQAGFVVSFATARPDESLTMQLTEGLRSGLDGIGINLRRPSRLRDRIDQVSLELGAGPVKAGVAIDTTSERPVPGWTGAAATAFRELLQTASETARNRGSAGLCVLVDEIQAAPPGDLRTVAYAWQELQSQAGEPAAVLFAAGLPNTPDVLTKAVTFSERFAFRSLSRFSRAESEELLRSPAGQHEVTWEDAALAAAVDLGQGFPYYLQLIGDAVWRVADPRDGAQLTAAHVERAKHVVAEDMSGMFRARWGAATPAQRRLLVAMARVGDPASRADIADGLQVHTNDLSVPRRDLIDKGIIEPAGRGLLRFTSPGFREFVLSEADGATG